MSLVSRPVRNTDALRSDQVQVDRAVERLQRPQSAPIARENHQATPHSATMDHRTTHKPGRNALARALHPSSGLYLARALALGAKPRGNRPFLVCAAPQSTSISPSSLSHRRHSILRVQRSLTTNSATSRPQLWSTQPSLVLPHTSDAHPVETTSDGSRLSPAARSVGRSIKGGLRNVAEMRKWRPWRSFSASSTVIASDMGGCNTNKRTSSGSSPHSKQSIGTSRKPQSSSSSRTNNLSSGHRRRWSTGTCKSFATASTSGSQGPFSVIANAKESFTGKLKRKLKYGALYDESLFQTPTKKHIDPIRTAHSHETFATEHSSNRWLSPRGYSLDRPTSASGYRSNVSDDDPVYDYTADTGVGRRSTHTVGRSLSLSSRHDSNADHVVETHYYDGPDSDSVWYTTTSADYSHLTWRTFSTMVSSVTRGLSSISIRGRKQKLTDDSFIFSKSSTTVSTDTQHYEGTSPIQASNGLNIRGILRNPVSPVPIENNDNATIEPITTSRNIGYGCVSSDAFNNMENKVQVVSSKDMELQSTVCHICGSSGENNGDVQQSIQAPTTKRGVVWARRPSQVAATARAAARGITKTIRHQQQSSQENSETFESTSMPSVFAGATSLRRCNCIPSYSDLPHEIVVKVLSFVDLKTRVKIGSTCQNFRRASLDSSLLRTISLSEYANSISSECITTLFKHASNICQLLDIRGCMQVSLEMLEPLSNLAVVNIADTGVAARTPGLNQRLESVRHFLKRQKLESFCASGLTLSYKTFVDVDLSMLSLLDISGCRIAAPHLVLERTYYLTCLNIGGINLDDDTYSAISRLPLRHLDLSRSNVTDAKLRYLPSTLLSLNLSYTKVSSTHRIPHGIQVLKLKNVYLSSLSVLPELVELDIEGTLVGDGIIERITECHVLRVLKLGGTRMTTGGLIRLFRALTFLKVLGIDGSGMDPVLDAEAVVGHITMLPKLRKLILIDYIQGQWAEQLKDRGCEILLGPAPDISFGEVVYNTETQLDSLFDDDPDYCETESEY